MKKLKVLITAVMVSTMIVTLAGCGNDKKAPAGNTSETTTTTEPQKSSDGEGNTEGSKKTYTKDSTLPETLKAELTTQSYWIDGPEWGIRREGTGWYSKNKNICVLYDQFLQYTSDTKYKIDPATIKTADQVIDGMKQQFINMVIYKLPITHKEDYEITKKENVKINGWDMCRYEGHVLLADTDIKDNKASFVAYSVIKDNYPVYFVVEDITYEQNQSKEIGELADKIAKTFRDVGVN